ncbi:MAG: hypothetical protein Q8L71_11360 [Thiobacillus sp.]|nr:hypothetical protein [Thiobacillus sp.]
MSNLQEAVQLLSEGGVIDRLKEDAQAEREAQRAELLTLLARVESAEAERVAAVEKVKPDLLKRHAALKAELAAVVRELAALDTHTSFTIEKTKGKLRKLADPRIGQAINQLHDYAAKARAAFRSGSRRVKKLSGGYERTTESNAIEVADLVAEIHRAVGELEALQEARRPDNLAALLAEKIDPIKRSVRKLHGFG